MEYRDIQGLDVRLSRIAFGCWGIGGHGYGRVDDDEAIAALERAIDLGVTLFDTANVYGFGHSERLVSAALRSNLERVVICTKCGVSWDDSGRTWRDASPRALRTSIEGSLSRLRIERIPIVLLHWPDGHTPLEASLGELSRMAEEGKVGVFGVSNHFGETLERSLAAHARLVQLPYSVVQQHHRVDAARAQATGAVTMAYGALGRGILSGKYHGGSSFGEGDTRSKDPAFSGEALSRRLQMVEHLREVGKELDRAPAEVALRWVLDDGVIDVVVVGATTVSQIEMNSGVGDFVLGRDQVAELRQRGSEVVR